MNREKFDTYNGRDVYAYTLTGDGVEVKLSDFGATVLDIRVGKGDAAKSVCWGFNTTEEYVRSNMYIGATVGRVANRIGNGRFTLNGVRYSLTVNNGNNANHGGKDGFDKKFYEVREESDGSLTFATHSADGDQGFPGALDLSVNFRLVGKELLISYSAQSDRDTLWVPTCHTYFNLSGDDSGSIADTMLRIDADEYTPLNSDHIPTGEVRAVKGTAFDFTDYRAIGERADDDDEQLRLCGGYDHNYILRGGVAAAEAYSPKSGIRLIVKTDMPCVQLYTANGMGVIRGRTGDMRARGAFCIEPQYVPDAINLGGFEKPILKAGQPARHYISYGFDVGQSVRR